MTNKNSKIDLQAENMVLGMRQRQVETCVFRFLGYRRNGRKGPENVTSIPPEASNALNASFIFVHGIAKRKIAPPLIVGRL